MAKWLYADGVLYNTDSFQKIDRHPISSRPELWAVRAFYVSDIRGEVYVHLYTGDEDETRQAQEQLARWLQAPDIDYF